MLSVKSDIWLLGTMRWMHLQATAACDIRIARIYLPAKSGVRLHLSLRTHNMQYEKIPHNLKTSLCAQHHSLQPSFPSIYRIVLCDSVDLRPEWIADTRNSDCTSRRAYLETGVQTLTYMLPSFPFPQKCYVLFSACYLLHDKCTSERT